MFLWKSRSAKFLIPVGLLAIALEAQTMTFKGVVSDSVNGMLIEGVTVAAGGASTLTDAKGAFTLVTSGTSIERIESPGLYSAPDGDPANGSSAWNTKGQRSWYGITYSRHGRTAASSPEPGNPPLLKKSAAYPAHVVTFTKTNFHALTLNVPAGSENGIEAKMKSPFPLKNIFKLFLDPTIPDQGPGESPTTPDCGGNAEPDANLVGGQLNRHNFIMIGENHRRINLVLNGKVAWHYDTKNEWEDDEIWVLSNGNILHAHMKYIEEITPKKEVVWRYDNPAGTEIHTCQPIGIDKVLFLQNEEGGSVVKLYNKKTRTYEINKKLPEYGGNVHTQCRRMRMTAQGTYVFASMSQKTFAEYDKDFKLIRKWDVGSLWGGVPLKNGNFLLQREGQKESVELNRNGETVWSASIAEVQSQINALAPGSEAITATQTCERLSNGNTVVFTRYCKATLPQAIEITPDKKVVWILKDLKNLGDAVSMQFLDEPGYPEVPGETNH